MSSSNTIGSVGLRWSDRGGSKTLDRQWKQAPQGPGSNQFVLPVMWEDRESSYIIPFGAGQKLVIV